MHWCPHQEKASEHTMQREIKEMSAKLTLMGDFTCLNIGWANSLQSPVLNT